MNNHLDDALKAYFAPREDVPNSTKAQLRERLQNQAKINEKIPLVWIITPIAALLSLIVIFSIGVVMGYGMFLLLGLGYYIFTGISVAVVLIFLVSIKNENSKEEYVC